MSKDSRIAKKKLENGQTKQVVMKARKSAASCARGIGGFVAGLAAAAPVGWLGPANRNRTLSMASSFRNRKRRRAGAGPVGSALPPRFDRTVVFFPFFFEGSVFLGAMAAVCSLRSSICVEA